MLDWIIVVGLGTGIDIFILSRFVNISHKRITLNSKSINSDEDIDNIIDDEVKEQDKK